MLKTFPNYFLILNQDSSKNVNFSWKNNFAKILVKLIANYTTKISWFFPRFPVGISREMGYFFPFPTGNSKHRKWATLISTVPNQSPVLNAVPARIGPAFGQAYQTKQKKNLKN